MLSGRLGAVSDKGVSALCKADAKIDVIQQVLHVGRELPVTRTLKNILEKSFPEEYEERRQEAALLCPSADGEAPLPIFVMSCVMPGARGRMHYYRLIHFLKIIFLCPLRMIRCMFVCTVPHHLHLVPCQPHWLEDAQLPVLTCKSTDA